MAAQATLLSEIESINPATGEVIARFKATSTRDIPGIMARAREAHAKWSQRPLEARCAHLGRLRDALYARRRELADLVTRETGKPLVESLFADVLVSIDAAAYYASRTPRLLRPERVPHHNLAVKAKTGRLDYEPFGVIGIISPWNYPLAIPLGEMIPAVAAGNAVVWKPSELTPCCGALVGELFAQAGFPLGLVEVIQGGSEAGAALIEARPDKVIFTGSMVTGQLVGEACARRLIPSVLELGGKDAMIVLADADLETASSAAVWGSFTNCGQACLSVERIYVERAIAERFAERCAAKTRALKLGPGSDPDVEVGPMIRVSKVERVEEQLRDAVARGARILVGGHRRLDLGPSYFEPTLVIDVDHSMRLMQEETFGPVLVLSRVEDAEEAVALTNDSPFGLSASIWTGDRQRGRELAARLKAGAVMVNDVASYFGICEAPHGGRGASGWGRTHARLGLLEMVQVKYVDVDMLPRYPKAWWFGYDDKLATAADHFIEFLFAPERRRRWARGWGTLRRLFFRGHRI
ncbi:MAG TPA: aldehyde dehydrogenase family protein [Candidatus Acidoferrales bacterium]|nr:aldehyde dehydrogenase family protein [Candidatus Acidoferrales bacterium]